MEVALLLVQDLSTTSIAHQLGVCNRTVEVHRDKIFQALRIPGVGALTRLMILWGKLEPDDPRMPWAPVPPPTLRKTKSALRDFPSRGGRRTA